MKRKRVLLTGATGLIGRQVAPPLTRLGYDVLPVSRRGAGLRGHLVDDPEAVATAARAEALIHLAWYDGPNRMGAAENLDWVCASLRLLTAFAAEGGKRVVMVGSCAEYDWTGGGRMDEATPLRPASVYGAAKAATGLAVIAGARALGLSLAWARPFFCYGPGEAEGRLFGDIIKGLQAGKAVDCTDGLQRRDFLHTEDLGAALAALLKSPVEGAINIGSGSAVAVRDMIGTLARQMGREDLIRLGARSRPADDPA
ncbi:MAG: NAD(P)-dependent oxidoreductase, partial [Albidovulum sp.]|uniref:NAD-dependent epimerase/dehydratase family protein n=1 Tax=Albidovulum sp. TaxID=1872424 RepID=UPI003C92ECFF